MTTWGSATNHAKLGIDFSTSAMNSGGIVYTKLTIYYESVDGWTISDPSNTLTVSGAYSWSGSVNVDTTSTRRIVVYEATDWWQCFYGKTRWLTVNASFTGLWNNMNPSVSAGFTVPARPYMTPADPTGFTATRKNDNQICLAFTATSSESNPVSRTIISRQTDGGSWKSMPSVEGAGNKSWADTGVSAGHYYRYRIGTVGPSGLSSSWVYSSTIYMTPSMPSNVSAAKTADNNVLVSWTNNAVGDYTTRVYDGSTLVATVAAGASSYTVSAPNPLLEHTYSVAAVSPDGLESQREASNTVRLAAAPYQPTNLTPNGTYSAVGQKIVLTWQHNSSDSSAQTKAELQYSTNVTSPTWQTLATVTGTTATYTTSTLSAQTEARLWRVRTWGQDTNKPSPWATAARITIAQPPTATITAPATGTTIESNSIDVSLATNSAQANAYFEASIATGGKTLTTVTGNFTNKKGTAHFDGLNNNTSYTVTVKAGDYLLGSATTSTYKVSYPQPPIPTASGHVQSLTSPINHVMWVTSAGETPTQNIAVYRVEQGRRVLVADELPAQGSVNDYFAPTGTTTYQVVVTNTLGQTSSATTAITNTGSRHITLTTQDKKIAYLYWNPEVSHALNTYKANTYYMLGDTLPVMVAGKQQARSLTVSGIVIDTDMTSADTPDNYEMWRHILAQARPVLYRDPSDVTMWAMLSAVRLDKTRTKHLWDVSFTLTEVEPANL